MPGQRILDLVREHRGERGHRARGAAMGELAVHLVGHGALLQHDDDVARPLRHGRDMQIDDAITRQSRRAEIDLVFVDRRTRAGAPDRSAPAADCRTARDRAAGAAAAAKAETSKNDFGRDVGIGDLAVGANRR